MSKLKNFTKLSAIFLAAVCLLSVNVSAKNPTDSAYKNYQYNAYGESLYAPATFLPSEKITGKKLGISEFNAPTDTVSANGKIYILDSNNGRIVAINSSDYSLFKVYDVFVDSEGSQIDFKGAQGIAVSKDGNFYIADTNNKRILVFDSEYTVIIHIVLIMSPCIKIKIPLIMKIPIFLTEIGKHGFIRKQIMKP